MWSSLSLKNFQGFQRSTKIALKPLTILIGANSSGKSSVLRAFGLFKQSVLNHPQSLLKLDEPYFNFGSFSDLVYRHDVSRAIDVGFKLYLSSESSLETKFTFKRNHDAPYICNLHYLRDGYCLEFTQDGPNVRQVFSIPQEENYFSARGNNSHISFLPNIFRQPSGYGLSEKAGLLIDYYYSNIYAPLREGLEKIHFLSPYLEKQRIQPIQPGSYKSVGSSGEYTASVLEDMGLTELQSVEKFLFPGKVNAGRRIRVQKIASGFGQIEVQSPQQDDLWLNLMDVGFGYSQCLPIIIECIVAPADHCLFIEEPEIHLNPRLQTTLADLFTWTVQQKKQVVVETHSEHLVRGIGLKIAKGELTAEDVALYYFEEQADGCHVQQVKYEKNGLIKNWPEGFMSESFLISMEHHEEILNRKTGR